MENYINSMIDMRNKQGKLYKHNHVAIIVNDANNNIITYGYNIPLIKDNKIIDSYHAEELSILKLPYTRKNIKINIFVIRFDKNHEISNSKPCKRCIDKMKMIFNKGYKIHRIYYTNTKSLTVTNYDKIKNDTTTRYSKLYKMRHNVI